jgi:hypothetical protein
MLYSKLLAQAQTGTTAHWDITTLSTTATYCFEDVGRLSGIRGIYFSTTGDILLVTHFNLEFVYQYNLSTPWDVSTAVYTDRFGIGPYVISAASGGMFVDSSGTKMFITDNYERISKFTLTNPWNINVVTYEGSEDMPPLESSYYTGFYFKSDGSEITADYSHGDGNYSIETGALTTNWDITTMQPTSISSLVPTPRASSAFCIDGEHLIVANVVLNVCEQYNLSTPWDISSGTLLGSFAPSEFPNITSPNCYFNGTTLYVAQGGLVCQYDV